jgi:ribulose-5-phosphate 4-epimerase/fuculose-1-phosphate aldolase
MTAPAPNPSDPAEVRAEVARACHVLGATGHGDLVWGHASRRDPAGRGSWMKAAGWGLDEITPERVVLVDRDGAVVEGDGKRHLEYPIHTEILAARPDVGAVVHSHASWPVALAAAGLPLRPVSHDACFFGPEGVGVFTNTGDLIVTRQLGRAVAEALGDGRGLILARHGIVTVGPDLPTAVFGAILLDRASRTQLRAAAAGPISWSSDEELRAKHQRLYTDAQVGAAWAYLLRRTRPPPGAGV